MNLKEKVAFIQAQSKEIREKLNSFGDTIQRFDYTLTTEDYQEFEALAIEHNATIHRPCADLPRFWAHIESVDCLIRIHKPVKIILTYEK